MVSPNFLFGFSSPCEDLLFLHSHKLRKNTSVLADTILYHSYRNMVGIELICSGVQKTLFTKRHYNLDFFRALSKFEECNFSSIRDHLQLIPGAALNSLTENLTKSAWSVKLNHPETTFTPVWAPDKIEQTAELSLIQAQTLYFTSGNSKVKAKDSNPKDQKIM